jgi:hypothetical protein
MVLGARGATGAITSTGSNVMSEEVALAARSL